MPKTIIPRFAKRAALVEATLDSLGELGPSGVHPADICEELGLSKALVNYHFGSRDGLVAEAMALGYERCVDLLVHAVGAARRGARYVGGCMCARWCWTGVSGRVCAVGVVLVCG